MAPACAGNTIYADAKMPVNTGTEALTALHRDYYLVEARKLLEDTGDSGVVHGFVKLVSGGEHQ